MLKSLSACFSVCLALYRAKPNTGLTKLQGHTLKQTKVKETAHNPPRPLASGRVDGAT